MIIDDPLFTNQREGIPVTNPPATKQPVSGANRALRYAWHALNLRCPVCGLSPIFPAYHQFKTILDWFSTLPGCDHCGYDYQREPGYFLTAAWLLNWQGMFVFGLVSFVILDGLFRLSFIQLLCFNASFSLVIILLTVRHTKALFMALDHLLDPITSENGK